MAKVTEKHCQQHIQCVCGHGEVDSFTYTKSAQYLKQLGYRRRIDKSDGKPFYLRHQIQDPCPGHEDQLDTYDDDPMNGMDDFGVVKADEECDVPSWVDEPEFHKWLASTERKYQEQLKNEYPLNDWMP